MCIAGRSQAGLVNHVRHKHGSVAQAQYHCIFCGKLFHKRRPPVNQKLCQKNLKEPSKGRVSRGRATWVFPILWSVWLLSKCRKGGGGGVCVLCGVRQGEGYNDSEKLYTCKWDLVKTSTTTKSPNTTRVLPVWKRTVKCYATQNVYTCIYQWKICRCAWKQQISRMRLVVQTDHTFPFSLLSCGKVGCYSLQLHWLIDSEMMAHQQNSPSKWSGDCLNYCHECTSTWLLETEMWWS